jgi:hypothetical protein
MLLLSGIRLHISTASNENDMTSEMELGLRPKEQSTLVKIHGGSLLIAASSAVRVNDLA